MLGRGKNSEIGLYLNKYLNTNLSSNIIDLCPVGALTSKTYSFKYRPWEINNINSFDYTNSFLNSVKISLVIIKFYEFCQTMITIKHKLDY